MKKTSSVCLKSCVYWEIDDVVQLCRRIQLMGQSKSSELAFILRIVRGFRTRPFTRFAGLVAAFLAYTYDGAFASQQTPKREEKPIQNLQKTHCFYTITRNTFNLAAQPQSIYWYCEKLTSLRIVIDTFRQKTLSRIRLIS